MKAVTTQTIEGLLRDVAAAMRTLLKDTATAGNAGELQTIAAWIAEVEELTRRVCFPADAVAGPAASSRITGVDSAAVRPRSRLQGSSVAQRKVRFEREGDTLMKIAWSKRNRSEYKHKASRLVVRAVAARVEVVGSGRKLFRMESVLPVHADDGVEIPSYQAYLCVSWMKSEGLLEQHGRQGYTIPSGVTMSEDLDRKWAELPEKGE